MAQTGMPLQTQKNVKPRLLDQVRQTIRRKHYSLRTEATYIDWIKRYIFFHRKRHPKKKLARKPRVRPDAICDLVQPQSSSDRVNVDSNN